MPRLNIEKIPIITGTGYPSPFDKPCAKRARKLLGDAGGLTQFGALIVTLTPGEWSSQRHHHSQEDELVYIISGHPTLYDDSGKTPLAPGDVCTHPAGDGNGHHLKNETDQDAVFLVIGHRSPETDHARYPDIDLDLPANGTPKRIFRRKDGREY